MFSKRTLLRSSTRPVLQVSLASIARLIHLSAARIFPIAQSLTLSSLVCVGSIHLVSRVLLRHRHQYTPIPITPVTSYANTISQIPLSHHSSRLYHREHTPHSLQPTPSPTHSSNPIRRNHHQHTNITPTSAATPYAEITITTTPTITTPTIYLPTPLPPV